MIIYVVYCGTQTTGSGHDRGDGDALMDWHFVCEKKEKETSLMFESAAPRSPFGVLPLFKM